GGHAVAGIGQPDRRAWRPAFPGLEIEPSIDDKLRHTRSLLKNGCGRWLAVDDEVVSDPAKHRRSFAFCGTASRGCERDRFSKDHGSRAIPAAYLERRAAHAREQLSVWRPREQFACEPSKFPTSLGKQTD